MRLCICMRKICTFGVNIAIGYSREYIFLISFFMLMEIINGNYFKVILEEILLCNFLYIEKY